MIEIARWLGKGLLSGVMGLGMFMGGLVKFLLTTAWIPALVAGIIWFGVSQFPEQHGEIEAILFAVLAGAVIVVGAIPAVWFEEEISPHFWKGQTLGREKMLLLYLMYIMVFVFVLACSG